MKNEFGYKLSDPPWEIIFKREKPYEIRQVNTPHGTIARLTSMDEANAELIVKAVNKYYEKEMKE